MCRPIDILGQSSTLPWHAQISIFLNALIDLFRQCPRTVAASGGQVFATVVGSGGIQALGVSAAETAVDDLVCAVSGRRE